MPREPIPTWCFALVVVRKGDRFLLVQESKYGQPWYLPAGRVEAGESFAVAAVRETREEAGIPVRVTGVIRVEYSPSPAGARMRVIFLAEPLDDTPPKTEPDDESLGAAWVAAGTNSRSTGSAAKRSRNCSPTSRTAEPCTRRNCSNPKGGRTAWGETRVRAWRLPLSPRRVVCKHPLQIPLLSLETGATCL